MKKLKDILKESTDNEDSMTFTKGMKNPPKGLNGLDFNSYKAPKHWKGVEGVNHSIKEPPLNNPNKKPVVSGLLLHEPNDKDKRTWLVKPTNGFGGYDHTFPKGSHEKDLSLQENAIKETHEESGLKGKILSHAGDVEGRSRVTRYYHAVRTGGSPLEHGWESEAVSLVHPKNMHKFLNTEIDNKVAKTHLDAPDL
jgi:ADP-ribose pyrophosphatase YjhB (NUDIX family)